MSSPWGKIQLVAEPLNLQDIMSEEIARDLQLKENVKYEMTFPEIHAPIEPLGSEIPQELFDEISQINNTVGDEIDSDALIAQMLQYQYNREYDEELKRVENKKNGMSKVSVSYVNHRIVPDELMSDTDEDEEYPDNKKKDWDRFETNEKKFSAIPRCGYTVQEGKIITKHDMKMAGCRNACKVMAFPPEFHTGDAGGFDMQLSNKVFNSLKVHSKQEQSRRNRLHDRREDHATAEVGVDEKTRLLLFKMVNNQTLEEIHGVISTGKESLVLHANLNPSYRDSGVSKECAIKVFKTTLNEIRCRDKYIKNDFRFKDRFSKQNPRKVINLWAEKEMFNLNRMRKIGVCVPDVFELKKHILVMSFIGENHRAAPKLKEVILSEAEWILAYEEVEETMYKLYNEARLIHADLSEYNILWHKGNCWIIDVSQAVEPGHPSALEFLMRDCSNISTFFSKKGIPGVKTANELFAFITGLNPVAHNTAMLEKMHVKGPPAHMFFRDEDEGLDEDKPLIYPFDYAWEKSLEDRKENLEKEKVTTPQCMLNVDGEDDQ